MTSYNTGTTFKVTNSGTPSGTGTIPAGVLSGDTVYVAIMCFATATGSPAITCTSSATAPVQVGSQQSTGAPGGAGTQQVIGALFSIAAGASDPGATLTFGATGGTGGAYWFNVGLDSYTAAGGTDVNGGNHVQGQGQTTADITTPSLSTVDAGDWQYQAVMGGPPSGFDFSPVPPTGSGLTARQSMNHTVNQGLLLYTADSNGSVGGSGTSIGNTAWSGSAVGGATSVMASFTVGIAPGTSNITASFGLAMAPLKQSFTAAETITGQFDLAMAPLKQSFTGHETGANITASFGLAMAPLKMAFRQPTSGGLLTPDADDRPRLKRRRARRYR